MVAARPRSFCHERFIMATIDPEAFFKPLERETVHIDGIGDVVLQEMPGPLRDKYDKSLYRQQGNKLVYTTEGATARLVAYSVIDPATGERIFDDSMIDRVNRMGSKTLAKLATAARRLSGLTDDEVEDEAKN